jgi:tRNA dimethylallyltransferase
MNKSTRIVFNKKIIVIVGPTASGKSDLAIKIAKNFNGEIISADSRQVYKGMDIGTGKVLRDKSFSISNSKYRIKELKLKLLSDILHKRNYFYSSGIRHHLIDVVSPKKQFTVSDFKKLGKKALDHILNQNKIPIIVGGAGFYIDVLLDRISIAEVPPNKKLRANLEKLDTKKLFEKLKKLDPRRAQTIESKNKRRLIRALEIVLSTKKPVPVPEPKNNYQILWLGLNPENLKQRIKIRLDKRLNQGMIDEIKKLHKQGVSWKRLDELGLEYRWVSRWLKNNKKTKKSYFFNSQEYKNLLGEIIKYSKRQMVWFKRNNEIKWIKNSKEAEKLIRAFLIF